MPWDPPLSLFEVHWARALLQSRPLKIGSGTDADPKRFFLIPFVDMLNTIVAADAGDAINVKLQAFRAGPDELSYADDARQRPRAVLTAARPIAAGEELFLS